MKKYIKRKFSQDLLPRTHQKMYAKIVQLDKSEGLRRYKDKEAEELKIDGTRGPLNIEIGDMVTVLDYTDKGQSVYYLMVYMGLE